jgi:4-hydroxy-3-methylbut-2-enyl diphosphate reductase
MRVILAQPRGFCAGVVRAIEIVERALDKYDAPVYVRHEIVHNRHVVDGLKAKGAHFVKEVSDIPANAVTIFSAHGVAKSVESEAATRGLPVLDATCPLVTKVHIQGKRYISQGRTLILIGHAGHPEVEGTIGQIPGTVHLVQSEAEVDLLDIPVDTPVAYVTQTTLSVDDTRGIISALQRRFADIVGPDVKDICYATQNRQEAVRKLASDADVVLVLGSQNSSNSQRLAELARESDARTFLIDGPADINFEWFTPDDTVLVTAGASAPEIVVEECVALLREHFAATVESRSIREEEVYFPLPKEFRQYAAGRA